MTESKLGGPYSGAVEFDQTLAARGFQPRQQQIERQSGIFMKQAAIETVLQAQSVEHELETQVGIVKFGLADTAVLPGLLEVAARLTLANTAQHPVLPGERDLAMRACADTEIIAEVPVVQVVLRFAPLATIAETSYCRYPFEASSAWPLLCCSAHKSLSGKCRGGLLWNRVLGSIVNW